MPNYYGPQYDNQDQPRLLVFIAGACANNGRRYPKMGWAYKIMDNARNYRLASGYHGQDDGTNQRAVLLAYLDALDKIRKNDLLQRERVTVVEVVTRQEVVTQTFTEWIRDWRRPYREEYLKPDGKRAANADLIADILDAQEALRPHTHFLYFARQGTDRDEMEVAEWAEDAAHE
eukprot:GHVU01071804.1.p1 GENE.GHVU01071804.1~~GHVU01071804.1.p1  ORF type:complete len:175 (-),score=19.44 GHVU01071804.1:691-1215(-)